MVKELALPGELTQNRNYDFEFMQVEKPYESYVGANVRLRYNFAYLLMSVILVCFVGSTSLYPIVQSVISRFKDMAANGNSL